TGQAGLLGGRVRAGTLRGQIQRWQRARDLDCPRGRPPGGRYIRRLDANADAHWRARVLRAETKARVMFAKLDSGKAAQYTVEIEGEGGRRVYRRLDSTDEIPPNLPDYAGH